MSKANQTFKQNDEAVSPVIGVILMVAITVVLAAVVFVLVSNLGKGTATGETAGINTGSPATGVAEITLTRGGDNAPYQFLDSSKPNYASITVDGVKCIFGDDPSTTTTTEVANVGATAPTSWSAGGVVRLDGANAAATGCVAEVDAGANASMSVAVAGTLIHSSTLSIKP